MLGVLTTFRQFTLKKGKETQIRVTSTILTNYLAQLTFFFLLRSLRIQTPKSLESKGYAVESLVTITSLQRPLFWRTVHTFTLVSTSLQRSLSHVLKVAVVERFNFIIEDLKIPGRGQLLARDLTLSFSRILKK